MNYKKFLLILLIAQASIAFAQKKEYSGNPVFEGWYADPEAKIFDKTYWIYPTYSAPYREQVLWMRFHHPTWCIGQNTAMYWTPAR